MDRQNERINILLPLKTAAKSFRCKLSTVTSDSLKNCQENGGYKSLIRIKDRRMNSVDFMKSQGNPEIQNISIVKKGNSNVKKIPVKGTERETIKSILAKKVKERKAK